MTNITTVEDLPKELQEDLHETFTRVLDILMIQQEIKGIRLATEWYGRGLPKDKIGSQVGAVLRGSYSGETLEKYYQVLNAENETP